MKKTGSSRQVSKLPSKVNNDLMDEGITFSRNSLLVPIPIPMAKNEQVFENKNKTVNIS